MQPINKLILPLIASVTIWNQAFADVSNPVKEQAGSIITKKYSIETEKNKLINKYLKKYTIQKWDNLNKIASKFNISYNELKFLRHFTEVWIKKIDLLISWKDIYVPNNYEDFYKLQKDINSIKQKEANSKKIKEYENWTNNGVAEKNNIDFFPKTTKKTWFKDLAKWLRWNMESSPMNPDYPSFVDENNQYHTNCVGLLKKAFSYSISNENKTYEWNKYFTTEWIDAWEVHKSLKKIWFTSEHNLMGYFDYTKIWNRDIVKNKKWYNKELLEIGYKFNKGELSPWAYVTIYFHWSRYKNTVKKINKDKKFEDKSINTHAWVYIWVVEINLSSNDVKLVKWWKIIEFKKWDIRTVEDFVIDFIQQRSWLKSSLWNNWMHKIKEKLKVFAPLINISINWKKINLAKELKYSEKKKTTILKNDKITIKGWVLIDWFHDKLNKNPNISEKNKTRSHFFWEFITEPYTISQVFNFPTKANNNKNITEDVNINNIQSQLEIKNYYYLERWENINIKLTKAILKNIFNITKELEVTNEELIIIEQIHSTNDEKKIFQLNKQLVKLKKENIFNIKKSLSSKDQEKFRIEYNRQIKALQLIWVMQSESKMNKHSTIINAPIWFYDTSNVDELFSKYIDYKRLSYDINSNNIENNYIKVTFLPWDNSATIYSDIVQKLKLHSYKYPNFNIMNDLDILEKRYFLEQAIDKPSNNERVNVSNGKFDPFYSIDLVLEKINNIIEEIKYKKYITEIEVSPLDNAIIHTIWKTRNKQWLLQHIITKESYIREWHIGYRKMKKIAWRLLNKVSSYWDFQTRMFNLNWDNALNTWPTKKDILEAIELINSDNIKEWIKRREIREDLWIILKKDRKIISDIKEDLTYMSERKRKKIWKKTYKSLVQLFRFDDWTWKNILWKIIQTSLVQNKLNFELNNIINWIDRWWKTVDTVFRSKDIMPRVQKIRLEVFNKGEKKVLRWVTESYIQRILSVFKDSNKIKYPELRYNKDDQLLYWENIFTKRIESYYKIIKDLETSNTDEEDIKKLLLPYIKVIIDTKGKIQLNKNDLFNLFRDNNIKDFLTKNWQSDFFLPTLDELKWTKEAWDVRKKFFWYSRPSLNRKWPKINTLDYIDTFEIKALIASILSLIGWSLYLFRRKIKSKIKNILKK